MQPSLLMSVSGSRRQVFRGWPLFLLSNVDFPSPKKVARLVASLGLWLLPPGVTHLLDEDPSYSTEAC